MSSEGERRVSRRGALWAAIDEAFQIMDPVGIAGEEGARDEYDELVDYAALQLSRSVDPREVAAELARRLRAWGVSAGDLWIDHAAGQLSAAQVRSRSI